MWYAEKTVNACGNKIAIFLGFFREYVELPILDEIWEVCYHFFVRSFEGIFARWKLESAKFLRIFVIFRSIDGKIVLRGNYYFGKFIKNQ